ncbi:MAG: hypothetical protein AAGA48_02835 [Myxococcota bacterium]
MHIPREPGLDATIAREGLTPELVQVYGDWWAQHGHPLGDYIHDAARSDDSDAQLRARRFRIAHATSHLSSDHLRNLRWVGGMISELGVDERTYSRDRTDTIERAAESPLTALMRTLTLHYTYSDEYPIAVDVRLPNSLGRIEITSTLDKPIPVAPHTPPGVLEVMVNGQSAAEWPDGKFTRLDLGLQHPAVSAPLAQVRELHVAGTDWSNGLEKLLARAESVTTLGLHGLPLIKAPLPSTVETVVWQPAPRALDESWFEAAARLADHVRQVVVHGLAPDRALPERFAWSTRDDWPLFRQLG